MAKKEIKTDSLILEPGTLPTVGVEGELRVDSADSNKLKKYDTDSASWMVAEGSGGSGGINYIENPDAESNIDGWNLYKDAALSVPENGFDGSASISFSRNDGAALRGVADFVLDKDAVNRQGEGVAYAFTIDSADKSKVLRVSFDYKTSANYVDDYLGVYLYNVSNSELIYPISSNLKANTVNGTFITEFQASATGNQYRLIFHVATNTATDWSINFDNIQVGPRELAKGSVVTDWVSYTPTLKGQSNGVAFTNQTTRGWYRRVGDSVEIQITSAFSNTPAGGTGYMFWNLPSGISVDSSKFDSSGNENSIGTAKIYDASSNYQLGIVSFDSTSGGLIITGSNSNGVSASVPITFTTNDIINLSALIPVSGWSSNAVISSDFGNRVVAARAFLNANQTIPSAATSIVQLNEVDFDSTNSWDIANNEYIVPETGYYHISAQTRSGSITAGAGEFQATIIRVNGVNVATSRVEILTTADSRASCISSDFYLVAGDLVTLNTDVQTDTSYTIIGSSSGEGTYLSIHKIQSPQTLMGSEVIGCKYTASAQSVATAGTFVLDCTTKVYDTHNAYSSGVFTVPTTGKYMVSVFTTCTTTALTTGSNRFASVRSSGTKSGIYMGLVPVWASITTYLTPSGTFTDTYNAGDTISVTFENFSGSTLTLDGTNGGNWISIQKVG